MKPEIIRESQLPAGTEAKLKSAAASAAKRFIGLTASKNISALERALYVSFREEELEYWKSRREIERQPEFKELCAKCDREELLKLFLRASGRLQRIIPLWKDITPHSRAYLKKLIARLLTLAYDVEDCLYPEGEALISAEDVEKLEILPRTLRECAVPLATIYAATGGDSTRGMRGARPECRKVRTNAGTRQRAEATGLEPQAVVPIIRYILSKTLKYHYREIAAILSPFAHDTISEESIRGIWRRHGAKTK